MVKANAKNITSAEADLIGHTRKIATVNFHPTANNVLLTSGSDFVMRAWDITHGTEAFALSGFGDLVTGVAVSYQGDLLATTSRDKQLRIFDMRGNQLQGEVTAHTGSKGARVTWLGAKPQVLTVGFGKSSEREFKIWDTRSLATPLGSHTLDQLAGVISPFYDEDTGVLYLAGRGDSSIKMFEIVDEAPFSHYLTEYSSSNQQMGVAWLPKRSLDVRACEIARFIKVSETTAEPIQMTVPRTRTEFFQDDIFPPTRVSEPTYTSEEWLSGAAPRDPARVSLQPEGMELLSQAPAVEKKAISFLSPKIVDNTPSRDQVMNKFFAQVNTFKEDENTNSNSAHDGDENDDEWD
jgi:hypothetical protein